MNAQDTMWAVQFRSYGSPEVLEVGPAAMPSPGPKDVVVKVAAFSINAVDLQTRRGKMRLFDGMGFPKGTGVDFAGLVHEVGDRVRGCGGAVRASPCRSGHLCAQCDRPY